ncbi:periplasmic glucan biosynthesis protein [Methylobacterium sp. 4-46]|uniref:glucans biosynthesis glucosyltransferase MdoH n=1 Tax=unclassified Methylobacterium TaxID=2615210 RepID=UPI000152CC2E|nr:MULTISPECIES: glucans biosynthesis glucosyltransferase MdoH [Methylobacterium]ACA15928.1 periplasmic glucan biosynthesis protein [Methylobacterium sp. 4-46]WFT81645.1 glucans biosynthesis glucosyltransferase MdoH [Methylobacterium nodulans]
MPPASPPDAALIVRRLALALPTLATAAALAGLAAAASPADGLLDGAVLVLFCLVMTWQAYVAWQYVYGAAAAWLKRRVVSAVEAAAPTVPLAPSGRSRTVLAVAIHAEDPVAVFAAIRVMARSIARAGGGGDIDIFVLSDTRDAAIAAAEERELARARAWCEAAGPGLPRLRYRRRAENTGRKAGNIAEFCRRHGDAYEFMVVLDADSLMSGATIRRLIRLMEAHPRVGLIQTVSYAAGRDTLFARIQQFAVRLYAPLSIRALDTWQGPDGSYWGHNAILRLRAFAAHADLPVLPGRPPLGGEILCHDTVEGALLRRAGWELRLLPEEGGTWEEMPTNLVDLLGRERRWCQGNLQHLGLVGTPGLTAGSRWHLLVGILSYLASPLWLAFLTLGTARAVLRGDLGLLAYGLTGEGEAAGALAALTLAVLAAPKLLSLGHVLLSRERRSAFGGTRRLLLSAALEQVVWVLLWPVLMLFNAGAVASTLAGKVVRWDAQVRDDRQVPWSEAARLQADALIAGGVLAILLAVAGDPWLAAWMGPVAASLLLSPALSVLTSRADLGQGARRRGLFLTVDDTAQAPELRDLAAARAGRPPEPERPRAQPVAGEGPVWLATVTDDAAASPPR